LDMPHVWRKVWRLVQERNLYWAGELFYTPHGNLWCV
jgi:hypothetical protein